jgi:hypothetical protein
MKILGKIVARWFPTAGALTSPHCSEALEFTALTPIWTTNLAHPFLALIFSFIIILSMSHSFFLSALPLPQNEYPSFWKKQFYFLFFTNFETLFFVFIF